MTAILVLSEQALILLKHIQYIDKIAEHVARQDKLQNQLTNLNIKMLTLNKYIPVQMNHC